MENLSDKIKKISGVSDKIAGAFIVATMVLVVSNVVLRAAFNSPLKGTYEVVGLLTAVAVALGLAHCAFKKGHIAVEFIMAFFPQKLQVFVNIINSFIALCFWSIATFHFIKYGNTTMERGLVTATSEIPVFPFVYLIAIGFLVLCLVLITSLKEDIKEISKVRFSGFKMKEIISEESL